MPVILTDPCSLSELQKKQACYTCFSKSERLQLKVWFLGKLLEQLENEAFDFTATIQEMACFGCEPDSVLDAFEVASLQAAADSAGATEEGIDVGDMTAAELKAAIKCYPCVDPKLMRAAYTWLLCHVSQAAVPALA